MENFTWFGYRFWRPDIYKKNPNGITRCQSVIVNKNQHHGNWTKIRKTSSVPGDSSCSQWVEQSAKEVIIPHGREGRATRSRNLTEKCLVYKKETLRERRKNINSRLIRKYFTMKDYLPVRTQLLWRKK